MRKTLHLNDGTSELYKNMNCQLNRLFRYEQCVWSDKLWKIFYKTLKKNIVLFIKDLIEATRTENRHYLFHFAVSFIVKTNVQAWILRLDCLLYARATLYARFLCETTCKMGIFLYTEDDNSRKLLLKAVSLYARKWHTLCDIYLQGQHDNVHKWWT